MLGRRLHNAALQWLRYAICRQPPDLWSKSNSLKHSLFRMREYEMTTSAGLVLLSETVKW